MALDSKLSVSQKALAVNVDKNNYGSFAEIGAGQEVVRHFFVAGGAAGTIAQSRSAYDMRFSDTIYGQEESKRYVCQSRVLHMLEHEHDFLLKTLSASKSDCTLFVFANTVTTKSYSRPKDEAHGWLGMRFIRPGDSEPSDIMIHVRLLDLDYLKEQEVVGIVGVNLIYGILYLLNESKNFLLSLADNLEKKRFEIDSIVCQGPACKHLDNRLLNLQLVHLELTRAILFNENGEIKLPGEVFYKRPVLVQRGSFRPITYVNMDMQRCAIERFMLEPQVKDKNPVILLEITLSNLTSDGGLDEHDFLHRIELISSLGFSVLISNFGLHYQFARYIARNSKSFFAFVVGLANLQEVMNPEYYQHLAGGMLEAFGKLFAFGGKIYTYPMLDDKSGKLLTSEDIVINQSMKHLYYYLTDNEFIVDLKECNIERMNIYSKNVLNMIKNNQSGWETMVPKVVAELIKTKKLWQ